MRAELEVEGVRLAPSADRLFAHVTFRVAPHKAIPSLLDIIFLLRSLCFRLHYVASLGIRLRSCSGLSCESRSQCFPDVLQTQAFQRVEDG